jgi:hypothetical protein
LFDVVSRVFGRVAAMIANLPTMVEVVTWAVSFWCVGFVAGWKFKTFQKAMEYI